MRLFVVVVVGFAWLLSGHSAVAGPTTTRPTICGELGDCSNDDGPCCIGPWLQRLELARTPQEKKVVLLRIEKIAKNNPADVSAQFRHFDEEQQAPFQQTDLLTVPTAEQLWKGVKLELPRKK